MAGIKINADNKQRSIETIIRNAKDWIKGNADKNSIENVIIRTEDRTTFCLSSQVGCPVQCKFCASGIGGLIRNLNAGEIVNHFMICCRKAGGKPDNIVFMGIGEPLLNLNKNEEYKTTV